MHPEIGDRKCLITKHLLCHCPEFGHLTRRLLMHPEIDDATCLTKEHLLCHRPEHGHLITILFMHPEIGGRTCLTTEHLLFYCQELRHLIRRLLGHPKIGARTCLTKSDTSKIHIFLKNSRSDSGESTRYYNFVAKYVTFVLKRHLYKTQVCYIY